MRNDLPELSQCSKKLLVLLYEIFRTPLNDEVFQVNSADTFKYRQTSRSVTI